MCRNIKTLANFEPPATDDEIRASALQFVRKLSGTTKPSRANEAAFNRAVDEVTEAARRLIDSLEIHAPPRDRQTERLKAQERSRARCGTRRRFVAERHVARPSVAFRRSSHGIAPEMRGASAQSSWIPSPEGTHSSAPLARRDAPQRPAAPALDV